MTGLQLAPNPPSTFAMLSLFDKGPPPSCPAQFNLAAYALRHASETPNKTALELIGGSRHDIWSFHRLEQAVLATGAGLLDRGLRPGDLVLLRLGHSIDFPLSFLGAIAVGLVPVPCAAQLTEIEIAKLILDLAPAAIIYDPEIGCFATERAANTACQIIDLAVLRDMRQGPPASYLRGDPNRLAYIIYTSGSSGTPRAVMHAHRTIWARRMMGADWADIHRTDRLLHAGAFNWTYTLGTGLLDPWRCGATSVISATPGKFNNLPQLLNRHEITIFAAVPAVFRKILADQTTLELPKLRHALSAGEKMPDTLQNAWRGATGCPVYEAYGMSECSTFISASPSHPARPGAVGLPQTGRRVAIVDNDGPVAIGTQGMIAISRHDQGLMLGYRHAKQALGRLVDGEWFVTGDQGIMDRDGQIEYCGRADDIMTAGGYRVSPLEVEAALRLYPNIGDIAVTEVEVRPHVSVIAAFYTGSVDLDHDAVNRFVKTRLARYKQPRLYVHISRLPTGPNNKILRHKLRDYYRASV